MRCVVVVPISLLRGYLQSIVIKYVVVSSERQDPPVIEQQHLDKRE